MININMILCVCVGFVAGLDQVSEVFIKARISVAQCRASCIQTFSNFHIVESNYQDAAPLHNIACTTKTNWKCNMCWDYCDVLAMDQKTRSQMCHDDICLDGCKHACTYYDNQKESISKNDYSFNLFNLKVSKGKIITWDYQQDQSKLHPVFLVFGLKADNTLVEVQQTYDTKIDLTKESKFYQLRIIAVSYKDVLGEITKKLAFKLRVKRSTISKDNNTYYTIIDLQKVLAFIAFLCIVVIIFFIYLRNKKIQSRNIDLNIV